MLSLVFRGRPWKLGSARSFVVSGFIDYSRQKDELIGRTISSYVNRCRLTHNLNHDGRWSCQRHALFSTATSTIDFNEIPSQSFTEIQSIETTISSVASEAADGAKNRKSKKTRATTASNRQLFKNIVPDPKLLHHLDELKLGRVTRRQDRVFIARKYELLEKNPKFLRMRKEMSKPPVLFRRKAYHIRNIYSLQELESFEYDKCPPEVAIIGRSNVGKSTLLNALLDFDSSYVQKAKMSSRPGETRALQAYGIGSRSRAPLLLIDLPGYGFGFMNEEMRESTHRLTLYYLTQRNQSRLKRVLLLLDARHGFKAGDIEFFQQLNAAAKNPMEMFRKSIAPENEKKEAESDGDKDKNKAKRKANDEDLLDLADLPKGKQLSRQKVSWTLQIVLTKCDLIDRDDLARRIQLIGDQMSEKLPGFGSMMQIMPVSCLDNCKGVNELKKELAALNPTFVPPIAVVYGSKAKTEKESEEKKQRTKKIADKFHGQPRLVGHDDDSDSDMEEPVPVPVPSKGRDKSAKAMEYRDREVRAARQTISAAAREKEQLFSSSSSSSLSKEVLQKSKLKNFSENREERTQGRPIDRSGENDADDEDEDEDDLWPTEKPSRRQIASRIKKEKKAAKEVRRQTRKSHKEILQAQLEEDKLEGRNRVEEEKVPRKERRSHLKEEYDRKHRLGRFSLPVVDRNDGAYGVDDDRVRGHERDNHVERVRRNQEDRKHQGQAEAKAEAVSPLKAPQRGFLKNERVDKKEREKTKVGKRAGEVHVVKDKDKSPGKDRRTSSNDQANRHVADNGKGKSKPKNAKKFKSILSDTLEDDDFNSDDEYDEMEEEYFEPQTMSKPTPQVTVSKAGRSDKELFNQWLRDEREHKAVGRSSFFDESDEIEQDDRKESRTGISKTVARDVDVVTEARAPTTGGRVKRAMAIRRKRSSHSELGEEN